jgi:RNA polymerase sigma factor (sigma-70 family)
LPVINHYKDLTDEELLSKYQHSRDKAWLGILLPRYTLLLLGVAMKYLKDRDTAQDAVQQIFLKTLTHLPADPIQNFKGWLYILMRNHCLQALRDRNIQLPEEALQHVGAAPDDMPDIKWKEYSLEQLAVAMQELNEAQRRALDLFYLQQVSYQQIMEQTGWTFMQVKSHIQNGKRNLKIILAARLWRDEP